jgi:4-amino-4-deoxy-L-arabinose transferase-like glycosyltransferase
VYYKLIIKKINKYKKMENKKFEMKDIFSKERIQRLGTKLIELTDKPLLWLLIFISIALITFIAVEITRLMPTWWSVLIGDLVLWGAIFGGFVLAKKMPENSENKSGTSLKTAAYVWIVLELFLALIILGEAHRWNLFVLILLVPTAIFCGVHKSLSIND